MDGWMAGWFGWLAGWLGGLGDGREGRWEEGDVEVGTCAVGGERGEERQRQREEMGERAIVLSLIVLSLRDGQDAGRARVRW